MAQKQSGISDMWFLRFKPSTSKNEREKVSERETGREKELCASHPSSRSVHGQFTL